MAAAFAQIHIKAPPETKSFLQVASRLSGTANLTDYILRAAVDRAKADMLEHRHFALGAEAWAEFELRLDAPPRDLPELRALLTTPDVFAL